MGMIDQPVLRSVLSVAVAPEGVVAGAFEVEADGVCLGFADEARDAAAAAVAAHGAGRPILLARVSPLASGRLEDDLDAVVRPGLDAVHVADVRDGEDVRRIEHYLTFLESTRDMTLGAIGIVVSIDSTSGLANVEAVCVASPRLSAAVIGAESYVTSLGVHRTRAGDELLYARMRTANAAAAAGLVPLDSFERDAGDLAHFERDARRAKALGYRGKFCLDGAQVEVANRVFAPSHEQLEWARDVVRAFESGRGLDAGAVEEPVYRRAVHTLQCHERRESIINWR
jgi:citrate lyase beta subunit